MSSWVNFQQCGSLCPQVCGGPSECVGGCAEGCFCPDGQVTNDEGQCVLPGNCGGEYKRNLKLFYHL